MSVRSAAEMFAKTTTMPQQVSAWHAGKAKLYKKGGSFTLMENFKKLLNGKLPKDSIHSGMILGIVKSRKMKDKQQLLSYLHNQELLCREWLAKNKGSTMNDHRREYARKLENINAMKKILDKL